MLIKLAFKNAAKSFKDYAIYFLTLTLGVCIFYMFNSIYAQQEIMTLTGTGNESMVALRQVLSIISVFVAVILGFLIIYANSFFIKRRKKELGVYMTLGMNKRNISTILLWETAIIAVVALTFGLVLGVFGSQFMSLFTAKIFEADMTSYKFVFSLPAVLKSAEYFGIIFLVVIVFNTIAIGKVQLIELLYGDKKNESLKIKNTTTSVIIFIFAVLSLIGAYVLILKNGMIDINSIFWLSIILGTIGTILLFLSLSGFLVKAVQKNKKVYYRGLNMFTLRQINSKVNTNFVSVSVVCIILLLVIGIFSCGYSLQNVISKDLRKSAPYDISILNYNEETIDQSIMEMLPEDSKGDDMIRAYAETKLAVMTDGKNYFEDYDVSFPKGNEFFKRQPLRFISLSDYNKMRELLQLPEYELKDNNYLVLCANNTLTETANQFVEKNLTIAVAGTELLPVRNVEDTILYSGDLGAITFVVNDKMMVGMKPSETHLNIQCINEDAALKLEKVLNENVQQMVERSVFSFYTSKEEIRQSSVTTKAVVSFLAIYLGIVFMITCAAILAIQQLSEVSDNRHRFSLLKKLGVSQKELNKALFRQILCYFAMPLSLAVVHSAVGLTAANEVIKMVGKINIASSIAATAIFVVTIYGVYFFATYLGCKSIITKETN